MGVYQPGRDTVKNNELENGGCLKPPLKRSTEPAMLGERKAPGRRVALSEVRTTQAGDMLLGQRGH